MQYLSYALVGFLLVSTALPLSNSGRWWIRVLDFPRLQLFIIASIALVGLLFFPNASKATQVTMVLLCFACLCYHLAWILPYTVMAHKEVEAASPDDPGATLKLLNANVLQSNKRSDLLVRTIRACSPDIIVTLETNERWQNDLKSIEADYPYRIQCPKENLYGIHLYSRLKLHNGEIKYLLDPEIPSIHCDIEMGELFTVQAHFLHPVPPVPNFTHTSDARDAELIVVAKAIQNSTYPCVVAGDLNDVAWSTTTRLFRKISGLLDPRIGRGFFNTFHAGYLFLRWPLDHVFHSGHFRVVEIKRLESIGSDHFPLYIELALAGVEPIQQNHVDLKNADEQLADEKLENQDVSVTDVPGH